MYLGYNTNGLAHHALDDAIRLVHEIGYQGIAITLDHGALDPFASTLGRELARIKRLIDDTGLRTVVETGARYLLDSRHKHHPTLLSANQGDRDRRVDFLRRAIDVASVLGSDCVSLWSGSPDDDAEVEVLWDRLTMGLRTVIDHAKSCKVAIGFEPEPGMFIDTLDQFAELQRRSQLRGETVELTLDLGHLHCLGELPVEQRIREQAEWIVNVHIEDMRRGVHEHLMFGEGEMDFPPLLAVLADCGYNGGVFVELSRDSHRGPDAAREAFDFLTARWPDG